MPLLNSSKIYRELGWVLSLLLVIASMTMIFVFSSQNATQSSATSGAVVDVVIDVTVPEFDSLPTQNQEEIKENTSHVVRKLAHFTEFAILGFSLCLHIYFVRKRIFRYWEEKNRIKKEMPIILIPVLSLILGALYACSDEYHQSFTEGRGPGVLDVFIDSAGVLFGSFVMFCILILLIKRKQKKKYV